MAGSTQLSDAFLCIDIGHRGLKAIAVTPEGEGLRCNQAVAIPLPKIQPQMRLEEYVQLLKGTVGQWQFKSTSVRFSLSGDSITVRFIRVPNITKAQLLSNIQYESSKYIPFPLEDSYIDCDVFRPAAGQKAEQVGAVVAAVKKKAVGDLARMLQAMGMIARLLDVGPLAMFNAFEAFGGDNGDAALLDIGAEKSHFGIVHQGNPVLTRDIDVATQHFNDALAAGKGLDAAKADQHRRQADQDEQRLMKPVFQNLARELRHSMEFFETEHSTQVTKVHIAGGGALTPGLAGFLQQSLEMPVSPWNPLESPKITLAPEAEKVKALGPQFGVCLGLAARKI